MNNFFQKNLFYILIFLVWVFFASPIFKGSIPFPSEHQVNAFSPWSSYSELSGPVKNNAMPDVITQIMPWKKFTIASLKKGQLPLWNPYSFSGTPHLANYQSAVLSPFNMLFYILPFVDAWSMLILLQPFLAGLFMFIFIRSLRVSSIGSFISAVSFMFCGFLTTWMTYGTLGYAILFLPLALFFIEKFYQTKKTTYLLLLSLCVPLSFFSGHFQASLYFLIGIGLYTIFKHISQKSIAMSVQVVFFIFLGIMLATPQLLPSIEFYRYSLRQHIFQMIEVIPWSYFPTLLAPDFYGNPVTRNDWFGHYAEWAGFAGVVPLLLSSYGLRNKKITTRFFFIILIFLAIFLAFDTPIQNLLIILKVPVFSTSAASRIIVLFSFSIAALAGFGFDYVREQIEKAHTINILLPAALWTIIFIFMWAYVFLGLKHNPEHVMIARKNLLLPTALFFAFYISLLFGFVRREKRVLLSIFALIVFLVIFDMTRYASKWVPFDPKENVFMSVPTTREYEKISGSDRFLGDGDAENTVYFKLRSLGGYDPLYIARYGEFVQYVSTGEKESGQRSVVQFPKRGEYTPRALELLGVKYISHKLSDGQAPWAFPFNEYPYEQFSIDYDDHHYQIFENKKFIPRAHIVYETETVKNEEDILPKLYNDSFDYEKSVILEDDISLDSDTHASGTATIIQDDSNQIIIETNSTSKGLLVLSDAFYPGWQVLVNDNPEQIYRANYTFRAVMIPKGEAKVIFYYRPKSFYNGLFFAGVGVALVSLYLAAKSHHKFK